MKISRLILALVALAFVSSFQTRAQYQPVYILGGTANSPASTDNTTFYTTNTTKIFCGKALDIAIQIDQKLEAAGTSDVVYRFSQSVNGTNWTANAILMTNTASGTTLTSKIQTYTVGGVGWLRLDSINNSNAKAVTNIVISYAQKIR